MTLRHTRLCALSNLWLSVFVGYEISAGTVVVAWASVYFQYSRDWFSDFLFSRTSLGG